MMYLVLSSLLGYDVPSVLSGIAIWSGLQPYSIACYDVHSKLLVSYHFEYVTERVHEGNQLFSTITYFCMC